MLLDWLKQAVSRLRPAPPEVREAPHFTIADLFPGERRARDREIDEGQVTALNEIVLIRHARSAREGLTFPPLAQHLIQSLSERQPVDINRLIQLVHGDPMISAQVLRAAHTARFAGMGHVTGIREAVMRLGGDETTQIALAAALRGSQEQELRGLPEIFRQVWRQQWLHSMTAALTCGWVAMTCQRGDLERAFLGGMLHDIGKTFALRALGAALRERQVPEVLSSALIAAVLEQTHVQIGTQLARQWGLPTYLVVICEWHHAHRVPGEQADLHIVRLVSALDEITQPGHRSELVEQIYNGAEMLALDAVHLRALRAAMQEFSRQAAAREDAQGGGQDPPDPTARPGTQTGTRQRKRT